MSNNSDTRAKTTWLGRYWYLALCAVGLVAFVFAITLISTVGKANKTTSAPVNSSALTFSLPIAEATVTKGYNDKALQYNATLNQWEVHKAIDFSAPVGANVFAVAKGVVTDIYSNYLDGTVIVISHANNLVSKYASLDSDVQVKVGDNVTNGQIIGKVSATAKSEASDNAHLHFEMLENDKKIDPSAYLSIESK